MTDQTTGTIGSGDVTLFYRVFGDPGKTPVLIHHGANYYDSTDWIDVAARLAADRQVVAWDMRGFGESTWSPSKDYSYDALMGDMACLLDHFSWPKAIIMGHSMGGGHAILFASRFPERTAALVIVDHCPGRGGRDAADQSQKINQPREVFATLDEALAVTSRDRTVNEGTRGVANLGNRLESIENGSAFRRDPDFQNPTPTTEGWRRKIVVEDMWSELAHVHAPILLIRGVRSDRYTPESLERVRSEFPQIEIVDVEADHDVAAGAPSALVDAATNFFATRID